jgi:hypothetical protein
MYIQVGQAKPIWVSDILAMKIFVVRRKFSSRILTHLPARLEGGPFPNHSSAFAEAAAVAVEKVVGTAVLGFGNGLFSGDEQ